ncbi:hypothetical protein [Clostridium sp. UBA5988]|uniref:hypothetical protein n=1 Tax=Clostridium sp. UBA5988 TaxID=1946369 RepID=UPI003217BB21
MSKVNIEFYYGEKNFEELMEKIILEKIVCYSFTEKNKICYSKDNHTTAIYSKKKE